jgi:hypothetical protein
MATATKTPKPVAKPGRKAARKKDQSSLDHLRQALDDLGKARPKTRQDARRDIGRMAIQAQRSPEALAEMTSEIRRRKQALTG